MNYHNRWLLLLATLATLSVFLFAVGQTPGRVYLPVVVKGWHLPPTPRPTPTPTITPTPVYEVTFAQNLSVTSINGSEATCRVDNGCTLFMIQVRNKGNRSVRYWVTKQQTVPIGWGVYFCWGADCFFGNSPPPKVLAPGQKENIAINFRVPSVLVDGESAVVDVRGYYSCDGCPDPTVYQPYTNQFRVLVILPTPTSPTDDNSDGNADGNADAHTHADLGGDEHADDNPYAIVNPLLRRHVHRRPERDGDQRDRARLPRGHWMHAVSNSSSQRRQPPRGVPTVQDADLAARLGCVLLLGRRV